MFAFYKSLFKVKQKIIKLTSIFNISFYVSASLICDSNFALSSCIMLITPLIIMLMKPRYIGILGSSNSLEALQSMHNNLH